ncbi:MAG: SMP-30/gluconolactonase/LRE family protein [Proteobacteria bacterium]|nr:SMP-30/gluconolactonase/LRE family protein [Pseudomonadota bacterium]
MDFENISPEFRDLVPPNSWVERLHTGMRWTEGPVWFADGQQLIFSDIPNDRMLRWVDGLGAGVFREPSGYSNGNTRDLQGRLVTCEHGQRRLTRTEPDGSVTVLVDRYQGRRLNSPNDVVVKSDGTIWFTDPPYGIIGNYEGYQARMELDGCYVFRLDPVSGELRVVTDRLTRPNGLAFSLDEKTLYVSDSARSHDPQGAHDILALSLSDDATARSQTLFASIEPGLADGFRLDAAGNVWTSAGDGVHCYAPSGKLLGKIHIPETVSNVVFGGRRLNRLFVTATTSVYSVYLAVCGAARPRSAPR